MATTVDWRSYRPDLPAAMYHMVDSRDQVMHAFAPATAQGAAPTISFAFPCPGAEQSAGLLRGASYLTPAQILQLQSQLHHDMPQSQSDETPAPTTTLTPISFPDVKSEPVCSVSESSSSADGEVSSCSDVVPEMQLLDFSEAPWDEFLLRKYPSLEIDWDAILS
ncbi:unnamed protein product [Triticum turgidum subsp. durum]|uniref:Uncharacterized protein n=1 Tax=Triticum turgidum subsp. durum TaxID=4567 RepID=A0A9R0T800_TRITD|nr:unnamed protein product [Triticum turgidum subsp. durum]